MSCYAALSPAPASAPPGCRKERKFHRLNCIRNNPGDPWQAVSRTGRSRHTTTTSVKINGLLKPGRWRKKPVVKDRFFRYSYACPCSRAFPRTTRRRFILPDDPAPGSYRRWAIFFVGSLNFVLSIFFRSSVAVVSPALAEDLGLSNAQLSDITSAFFYAFAFVQIPVGMALERFGIRITMYLLSVSGIGGSLLFALGQTAEQLVIGRVLLGIGMSGNLMTALLLVAAWFPVNRFGTLNGLLVGIGGLGSLLAATPLTYLHLAIGWRNSFLLFALANAIVVLAFLLVARESPPGARPVPVRSQPLSRNLRRVFRMYSYWAISLASFVRYGFLAALQGLWAASFLLYGLHMDEISAGNVIFVMGLGYMIGLPLSGTLSDRVFRSRKKVILTSLAVFGLLTVIPVCWSPSVSVWVVLPVFAALGFAAAPGQILYAHMKELIPARMLAQAMTAVNLFTMLGGGIITNIVGLLVSNEPSQMSGPDEFRPLWYIGFVCLATVFVLYSFVPDSRALRRFRS